MAPARLKKPKPDGFGIDFGTTNSVVATSTRRSDGAARAEALLAEGSYPHPSVVWYQATRDPIVGRMAKRNILGSSEEPGNYFATSIKRSLGKDRTFSIFGTKHHAWQIAAEVFKHLKVDARDRYGQDLERAVVTIPVDFDGRARRELRRAADDAGVYIKTLVHEPFAAIVRYLYSGNEAGMWAEREGQTILVFDWGGGTLDITLGQIKGGTISELATSGIADRSGDHFDEVLANRAKTEFMNRYRLRAEEFALRPSTKDRLRAECEAQKIILSEREEAAINLRRFYQAHGKDLDLTEPVARRLFEGLIEPDVAEAMAKVDQVLSEAGLRSSDVDLALLIGGSSRIPRVRQEMHDRFGTRMVQVPNADSIIAEGAAIVDALGLHPVLARPVCIELSDGSMYEVFKAGEIARQDVCSKEVALFCTDNRDGQARLIVKEGIGPFKDRFVTKHVLTIPVSSQLPKPYNHERVVTRFVIDDDLVLRISAKAATQREQSRTEAEVYDLCFALKFFGDA